MSNGADRTKRKWTYYRDTRLASMAIALLNTLS